MLPWLLILLGLVALIVSAEALVRGSAWIAEAMGVRPLVVGLTVVAIGTSAPELVVSLIATSRGEEAAGLALGNVFGSNVANIALILGGTAAIAPVLARESRLRFEMFWLIGAQLVCFAPLLLGDRMPRWLGISMVCALGLFVYLLVHRERRGRVRGEVARESRVPAQWMLHIVLVLAGLIGLVYGGDWLVDGAVQLAREVLMMSEGAIGASIVAVGTSLPELATSLVAARKGHPELALGNVLGSNIFNLLMVLGTTAAIVPIPVDFDENALRMLTSTALCLVLAVLLLGPRRLSRATGVGMLVVYIAYLAAEITTSA